MPTTKQEFAVLMLIHAAFIDYTLHPAEKQYIIKNYSLDVFDKMMFTYLTEREASFGFLKDNLRSYFKSDIEVSFLRKQIFELCISDRKYSTIEKAFLDLYTTELAVVYK